MSIRKLSAFSKQDTSWACLLSPNDPFRNQILVQNLQTFHYSQFASPTALQFLHSNVISFVRLPLVRVLQFVEKFTCNVIVSCSSAAKHQKLPPWYQLITSHSPLRSNRLHYGLIKKIFRALVRSPLGQLLLSSNGKYFIDRKTHKMNCGYR